MPVGQLLSVVNYCPGYTKSVSGESNGPGGLANAVGVCTVIAGNGAILKARALVTRTGNTVATPGETAGRRDLVDQHMVHRSVTRTGSCHLLGPFHGFRLGKYCLP